MQMLQTQMEHTYFRLHCGDFRIAKKVKVKVKTTTAIIKEKLEAATSNRQIALMQHLKQQLREARNER